MTINSLIRLRPRAETNYISRNRTVWITGLDGFITSRKKHGLFAHQTRVLSRQRYLINGRPLQPVTLSSIDQHSWLGYYIYSPQSDKPAAQSAVELCVSRVVDDGCRERLELVNYTGREISFTFSIELQADFADQAEIQGQRQQRGRLRRRWRPGREKSKLIFDYRAEHAYHHRDENGIDAIHRALIVQIECATTPPVYRSGQVAFDVDLLPGQSWRATLNLLPRIDGRTLFPPSAGDSLFESISRHDRKRAEITAEAARFSSPSQETLSSGILAALQQAQSDLVDLRLADQDSAPGWTIAAGLPVYDGLFGRDSLITAWQAAPVNPTLISGALQTLAEFQATTSDDWRDAQPGRFIHQMQDSPLASLNYNPFLAYYGSLSGPLWYCELVFTLWLWSGDKARIRQFMTPALKALQWLDRVAIPAGGSWYAYQTRSERGLKHQFWKDSAESVVYEDGSQVPSPTATCETQAWAYMAKDHLAYVLEWLGDADVARRLRRDAEDAKRRFNDTFWMDDESFFAMGLDPEGRVIRSIASDPSACLAAGIVEPELARKTADRLMSAELFSGWGIRTLSARHPAFNPFSYQRGSVWPVENSFAAQGFLRYGLHEHCQRLCRAQFEAAELFEYHRLPELFSGHPRDPWHPFPAIYPDANWPQAWSSASQFSLLQTLVGLYPCASLESLIVDPHLPPWLPEITVENLHIGKAVATIRFYRTSGGESTFDVLDCRGSLQVHTKPSPWRVTTEYGQRAFECMRAAFNG